MKKKEGVLPDLPPIRPAMRKDYESSAGFERPSLPSFPESPTRGTFLQSSIKEAVAQSPSEGEMDKMPEKRKPMAMEMDEWNPEKEPQEEYMPHYPTAAESKKANLFVKIDKFNSAKKELRIVKEKLEEIDNLLRKIRETKMREEQELSAWEKEVATIKSRIQNVTSNIFERTE